MEAGKAIGSEKAGAPVWARAAALAVNPLRAVWWLITNVRFATALLAVLSLVSLLGVLVPQMPLNVRGDSVAESQWLASKDGILGLLADPMDAIGLFDVFHTGWFAMLMGTTVASTGAYIASRFPGIWAAITHPRRRVPDRYFEMAPNRFVAAEVLDIDRLELDLRRQRYRVERYQESGATYLFADRLASAQLGTLLTHAAVIIFIQSRSFYKMSLMQGGFAVLEAANGQETLECLQQKRPDIVVMEMNVGGLSAVKILQ